MRTASFWTSTRKALTTKRLHANNRTNNIAIDINIANTNMLFKEINGFLNATVHTNQRSIDADDFFTGMFETALEENELITSVTFNAPEKAGYAKFDNPASRYAMAGVFVAKHGDGSVRVGVTGAGQGGVFRLTELEDALASNWSADAAAGVSVDADAMLSDIHGDGAYRANLVKVMAERAISAAG